MVSWADVEFDSWSGDNRYARLLTSRDIVLMSV